jgi:uracil-DNA glycosylase family 4
MLSLRQQQCLRGIGIAQWRERTSFDANATERLPDSPADSIANPLVDPLMVNSPGSTSTFVPLEIPTTTLEPVDPIAIEAETKISPTPVLDDWEGIINSIHACSACELAESCTQKVPGIGDQKADLMIIGEGPGHDEDIKGEPFIGRSGQLLDRMLSAIGIKREQVYITNIVKCRPPNNRDPKREEAKQCRVFLQAQIDQIKPRVILLAGRVSAQHLLESNLPVGKLIHDMHQLPGSNIPVKVTYHPAYLLRTPSAKAIAWQDLKLLHKLLR